MKKRFCLTAVLAVLLLAGSGLCSQETEGPSISVPQAEYQFDSVPDGSTIDHVFSIRNTGTEVLNIEKVRTG